jgi:protein-arginine kinase activator protein McsA
MENIIGVEKKEKAKGSFLDKSDERLKKVFRNYNFAITHPELAKEWDYEKNERGPEEYLDRSGKNVWWKCSDCGHSWKAKISKRTVKKSGCSKCYLNSKIK